MGNEGRSKIVGKGYVELTFTLRKMLTLINVLRVPEINRNLVTRDLLGKPRIKSVYEACKLIMSRDDVLCCKKLFY